MLHLIYLAAGSSKRFGGNKLIYEVNKKPMFWHGLSVLRACRRDGALRRRYGQIPIYMVVSQNFPREYITALKEQKEIRIVLNQESETGISSSIRAGLNRTQEQTQEQSKGQTQEQSQERPEKDYYLFCVADQPYLTFAAVKEFLLRFSEQEKKIGCMGYEGEPGNPVLFSEEYLTDLYALAGDTGGKKIVQKNRKDCFLFEISNPEELKDIDVREK